MSELCGIIGIWNTSRSDSGDTSQLYDGIRCIEHRGPEGVEIKLVGDFHVAHAKLTFFDPGVSDQPFISSCERYVVVFNGQIYNYDALRESLEILGHQFSGRSESELILALYREYGALFAAHIRGMFAIALRDRASDRLLLTRDYIGKKPLVFMQDRGRLCFASELRALMPMLRSRELDPVGLTSFFLMNAVDSRASMIAGVHKVGPGEVVIADRNGWRTETYWRPAGSRPREAPAGAEARLLDLLRQGVSRRLLDNGVQLGVMLSGGLDSSLVAALAAEQGHRLPSFSARISGAGFDESGFAASIASIFCSRHEIVDISDERLRESVERHFAWVDEPIADPSFLAVAMVTAAARGTCKGLLTGDGADDLFAGYGFFRAVPAMAFAARHIPLRALEWSERQLGSLHGSDRNLPLRNALQLLSRGVRVAPEWQHAFATSAIVPHELSAMLSSSAGKLLSWPLPEISSQTNDPLRRVQQGLIRSFLQARVLTKLDRGSMINGVELRSPFLDQDVAEFALAADNSLLINKRQTKAILHDIAARYLPQEILSRKKQGFRLPIRRLLRGPLRELLLDTLSPDTLRAQGVFDPVAVERLVTQHLDEGLDKSKPLWALLAFCIWQRAFNASAPSSTAPAGRSLCVAS